MKTNIGLLDQVALCITISLVFIYIGFIDKDFIYDSLNSNITGDFSMIFLFVALIRFYLFHFIVDINTFHKKEY